MNGVSRRRFLAISAAVLTAGPTAGPVRAAERYRWEGVALGAKASITLSHPDARRIAARAQAELDRLEGIFSLYRPDSALARLNRDGRLENPPFELLECLSLCGFAHDVTGGAFDPTIQPLWALYAEKAAAKELPSDDELRDALDLVGWRHVRISPRAVSFARPGMALTLNGIAQGFIADKVAELLRKEGLGDVLIDTGEIVAMGGDPLGGPWNVSLVGDRGRLPDALALRDTALASSSPLGTTIGPGGPGHILDPRSGSPALPRWSLVSMTAPSAAYADALSTAGCLMDREAFARSVGRTPGAAIAHLA
ncbi:FAD:protein FMN transferase [Oceanicella actignis]|uniref:FAD:protein FMN transferase n=1 Tax=Oceanicella actignis TaxID=1189325 RepID=UPI0011E66F57|nr:FAD:protein FMN transferase [Oceanicella actignis]TYO84574.1 thiamine biosynthesis lipoprotein [Oceanicella actignis]